jgi:hypothetical protein
LNAETLLTVTECKAGGSICFVPLSNPTTIVGLSE